MKKTSALLTLLFAAGFFSFGSTASAVSVLKSKGKSVLLSLDGENAEVGEIFNVINSKGKKTGAVRISKISGSRATGKLKGKAAPGDKLKLSKKARSRVIEEKTKALADAKTDNGYGAILGLEQSSWKVDSGAKTTLNGSNFSVGGYFDMNLPVISGLGVRAGLGIFMLDLAESGTSCTGQASGKYACTMKVTYLTAGGVARYIFMPGSIRPWAGLGATIYVPLSKDIVQVYDTTDQRNEDYITVPSTTFAPSFVAGVDIQLGAKMYLPVLFEYTFFAQTETVSPSLISARIGLGFNF